MGKATGFMEFTRLDNETVAPQERIKNYQEFHLPLMDQKRRQQASRCMNCGVPFCQSTIEINHQRTGCPLHNLIPEWNDEIYQENDALALSRLLKTNAFPEFTGRVCPALCEKACLCALHDEAITIRDNELYIIENGFAKGLIEPQMPTNRSGKRVAVVGSGPSGLSVAYKLNQRGHEVDVYEKEDRVGGLLMYGIPQMKLDKAIIKRRVELMSKEGITFYTSVQVGKDITKQQLLNQYDAVVLCCGSQKPRDLQMKNRDCEGVCFAVEFLKSSTRCELDHIKNTMDTHDKDVVIIGGGDTGNDCVGTCIRQGCKSVTQIEIMPRPRDCNSAPWPCWPNGLKTDYGQEESLAVMKKDPRIFSTMVKECIVEKGVLKAVKIVEVYSQEGKWQEKANSERVLPADRLIIAAGFAGVGDEIVKDFDLLLTPKHNVFANHYQLQDEKIFVAGDMRKGQSLVVWAIQEGQECAKAVDHYLMGYSYMNE